jgi:hypothetical protein
MANKKYFPEQKALIAFLGPTPKNISPFRPKPSVKASCRSPKLKMGGAPGVGVGLAGFQFLCPHPRRWLALSS